MFHAPGNRRLTPPEGFQKELAGLINKHSQENGSDTPDWILAAFLVDVLRCYNCAIDKRDAWYNSDGQIQNLRAENDKLRAQVEMLMGGGSHLNRE